MSREILGRSQREFREGAARVQGEWFATNVEKLHLSMLLKTKDLFCIKKVG
jgi:hypothetical protein